MTATALDRLSLGSRRALFTFLRVFQVRFAVEFYLGELIG
jgi:hypothetical protein